ncbi:MAG: LLM class flavin-dependent oxidoreductase [Nitrososphaerota archaeon]|nr:LLM class flavin-dependent oxidoreductase [Candidatus Bathyarchaeota archaeon]MDW8023901.1 LLM class flavin-dependent oxidoreductase [Nitrososphaerota archaeon]
MKFGISPSPFRWWTRIEQLEDWVKTAENLGYDGVFIPDHYNLPVPPFPSNELVDTWITLAYMAAKTDKIKLGSVVSPLPRWVPSQLAKVIATVDVLSNGRVIAGLGAGYYQDEFVNYAPGGSLDPPAVRFEKFLEGVQIILKLWSEEKATFNGKYYKLVNAILEPKPIQKPHPPLWSGGQRTRMIELTATYFDGWIPHTFKGDARAQVTPGIPSSEAYEAYVRRIKENLRTVGRDASRFTFGVLCALNFDSEFFENYKGAGCQYCIVEIAPPARPTQYLELTKKFAKEIIPSFA